MARIRSSTKATPPVVTEKTESAPPKEVVNTEEKPHTTEGTLAATQAETDKVIAQIAAGDYEDITHQDDDLPPTKQTHVMSAAVDPVTNEVRTNGQDDW